MADMASPAAVADSDTAVELCIPCEHQHDGGGCDRPADVWVVMHDVDGDCRQRDGGTASLYLCHQCWDPEAQKIVAILRHAAMCVAPRMFAMCGTCGLHFHRWSDVVYRVVPIRGTAS